MMALDDIKRDYWLGLHLNFLFVFLIFFHCFSPHLFIIMKEHKKAEPPFMTLTKSYSSARLSVCVSHQKEQAAVHKLKRIGDYLYCTSPDIESNIPIFMG